MKIDRIDIPKLPQAWHPTFFNNRSIGQLPTGKHLIMTPYIARPEKEGYIDKGVTALMTIGTSNAHLPKTAQSRFIDGGFLQNYIGGAKPLSEFTRAECIAAVWSLWNSLGQPGWITSGAQEGRHGFPGADPWEQNYLNVPNQYVWITEGFGEIEAQNPWFHYLGGYDGPLYLDPGSNPSEIQAALSSDAAALAFLKAREYGRHPYFTRELWRWQHVTLNQYFRAATDMHKRYAELTVSIELIKRALRAVGRPDRKIIVYCFGTKTEFVNYQGHGYTASWKRDVPAGGYWIGWDFPQYSTGFQAELAFTALDQANGYHGWEDTRYFGQNPNIVGNDVIRDDGFELYKYHGSGATRGGNDPRPYQASGNYCYPVRPVGAEDMVPANAEIYNILHGWAGGSSQFVRHRPAGTSTWCSLNPSYAIDRYIENGAWARAAQIGNKAWVKVTDMVMPLTGPRDVEVELPGGQVVTVSIEGQDPNYFLVEL